RNQYPQYELIGRSAQDRIIRREIPHRRDVRRGLQRISRDEIVVLEKVATGIRREEDDHRKNDEEDHHAEGVLHGVIGVKRNTVERPAGLGILYVLDLDAIGVARTDLVERAQVRRDEP